MAEELDACASICGRSATELRGSVAVPLSVSPPALDGAAAEQAANALGDI